MKLYEFEGHKILTHVGITSPFFVVASDLDEVKQARKRLKFPIVAKVQVLSGRRATSGGVKVCTTEKQLLDFAKKHLGNFFLGEEVRFIGLFEKVAIAAEFYLAITYDTAARKPFLLFSTRGGVDIEEVQREDPGAVVRIDIDPLVGPTKRELEKWGVPVDFAQRLWDAFWRYDCRLVEVNPLGRIKKSVILEGSVSRRRPIGSASQTLRSSSSRNSTSGLRISKKDSIAEFTLKVHPEGLQNDIKNSQSDNFVAIDAKVIIDDAGLARHRDLDVVPKGAISAIPSVRELEAKKIDEEDYRGSAGSTFIEFDGDLAVLASGGGASLLVMDSVVAAGGRPANYTEYSGNPPREKVEKLTKITLSREGLAGCLVAGAVANFTDIYETLSGFVAGLRQIRPKPTYPIVVRRGGPRQAEAYEMLEKLAKKEGYDIHLFGHQTPISVACRKMVELSEQYKKSNSKNQN